LQHRYTTLATQHLQHISEISKTPQTYSCNMRFSTFFFRITQHRAGERLIPSSQRLRMVARPGSGQLRLRLPRAWPATAPSPGRLAWARQRTEHALARQGRRRGWGVLRGMAAAARRSGPWRGIVGPTASPCGAEQYGMGADAALPR
jgi:hypothetical protein